MQKIGSILDYSYPGISPDIWLSDGTLNPVHKDFVLKLLNSFYNSYGLKSPEQWVIDVTVIGSLTTNRYIRTSDFDCHVIVNIDKFIETNMPKASKEEAITYLDNARKTWDRAKILMPFGEHVLELYIEDPNLNPSNTEHVGRYSMFQNKWLKDPIYFAQDLDFEESRKEAIEGAKVLANELDDSFGEIGRQIQRIDELKEVLQAWPKEKRQLYYAKVQNKLDIIEEQLEKSIQIKQDLVDTRHLKQDAFSENEIQFKFLARFHYFSILQNLKTLMEQTGGEVSTQELPLIEKIISQGSLYIEAVKYYGGWWLSPDGSLFEAELSHRDWMLENAGVLGISVPSEEDLQDLSEGEMEEVLATSMTQMFNNGWVRLKYTDKGIAIELSSLRSIPDSVNNFLLEHPAKEVYLSEDSKNFIKVDYEDAIENGIQKAVNKALQRKRMGSIKEAFLKEAFGKEPKEIDTQIAIDFDGTIAKDKKFPDIGEPEEGVKEALSKLKEMGYDILIYSCRSRDEEGLELIREYLDKHKIPYDSIFEGDKPFAKFYIDNRAIHFDNWDNVLEQVEKTEKKASLAIVAAPVNLPTIDPKTLNRTEPYALFIGTGDYGKAGKIDMFNVYGEHPMITKSNAVPTVTLDTLVQNNIPVIGKEPRAGDKQPFQDISGIVKKAYSSVGTNKYWITPEGKTIKIGTSEMHVDWVMHHLQQLSNMGVDVEDLSQQFSFYKGIYYDDLDGGEQETFNRIMTGMQMNGGWVRITSDDAKTQFLIDAGNAGFTPGVDNFIAQHFNPNDKRPIGAASKHQEYLEIYNPFPTLEQAYRKAAKSVRESSMNKEAGYDHAYWLDPNGKIYQVRGADATGTDIDNGDADTHSGWILRHLDMLQKDYGIDPKNLSGTSRSLVELGWTRIGDAYGTDWGIDVSNTDNIPSFVDDAIAQFAPEGAMITIAGDGTSRFQHTSSHYTFEWPVKSIQQTVQQLKHRQSQKKSPTLQQAAKLFSKHDIIATLKTIVVKETPDKADLEFNLDGKKIGYAIVSWEPNFNKNEKYRTLYLEYIEISPEFKNKGYGKEAYNLIQGYAKQKGLNQISLSAYEGDTQSFWKHMGFEQADSPTNFNKRISKKEITAKTDLIEVGQTEGKKIIVPQDLMDRYIQLTNLITSSQDRNRIIEWDNERAHLHYQLTDFAIKYSNFSDNYDTRVNVRGIIHGFAESNLPPEKISNLKQAQTKKVKQGDYSCLMALVPHDLAQEIVEWGVRNVPDEELYLDEDGKLGRELESHITIKYGLLTNDAKDIRRSFNDEKPFKAKLGKVKHFQPPELPFDVLTVEIISEDLEKANKKICDSFECATGLVSDEYHPHITIAYMKRDMAKEHIGADIFDGKEVELDTVIFSPHKGNRTYFSISNDKESSFILQEINKISSGDHFLPSFCEQPANNEWQFEHGGDDEEIALQPDSVSDETTWYAPCTEGKPRSKDVWRQFISIFKNPFSKNEEMTIDSAYDPELEQKEKDALGEDETLLEYSKGFYDPKKHDFPHNTTWLNTTYQDQEPSKPLPVTYSPQISNEDNLDQNSPGGFPRRFMGKPKGEWFSNEGEVNNALIDMLKNREAALDNITIDITAITRQYALYVGGRLAIRTLTHQKALKICQERFPEDFARGNYEVKEEAYKVSKQASIEEIDGITIFVNPTWNEVLGLWKRSRAKHLRLLTDYTTGDKYLWDAYYATHDDIQKKFTGFRHNLHGDDLDNLRVIRSLFEDSSLKQAGDRSASVPDYLDLLTKDITSDILKEAGSYSSTYTDEQGNDFKNEQLYDGIDDVPYVDKNNRDYPFGMRDMNDSSTDYPKPEDIEPYVVRLDILENPSYRLDPFGIGEYNVTWYESLPISDGIEKGNPE